jgi:hypothetical protein
MNLQQTRTSALIGLSIAALAGASTLAAIGLQERRARRAFQPVRDAGPENMAHPPEGWDAVDETVDESFPASDPPCHYRRSRYD